MRKKVIVKVSGAGPRGGSVARDGAGAEILISGSMEPEPTFVDCVRSISKFDDPHCSGYLEKQRKKIIFVFLFRL
jgi:hypothetical protein